MSAVSCTIGIAFVLAIAALHISGFDHYTSQIRESDASDFLKDMFPILYAMPSLYLLTLGAFGVLALFAPTARRPICLILAVAVVAAGALALMLGEWIPVAVMSGGALFFLVAALTVRGKKTQPVA